MVNEKKQQKGLGKRSNALLTVLIFIAIVVGINILGNMFFQRFDLTKEKRFTLTKSTKNVLKNLDDVVFVQVFLEGEFPAGFKRLQNGTIEMLNEFRSYAGSNLQFEFVDPLEGLDDKAKQEVIQQLYEKGVKPRKLQVKDNDAYSEQIIFPAALVFYKGRETAIQLLENKIGENPQEALNNSLALLEYKFAQSINVLQTSYKPKVALLQGHNELLADDMQWMLNAMSKYYTVEQFNINDHLYIPETFKCLLIAKPRLKFSEPDKYKIDQFIMNGGSTLWLVDPMIAEMDSLRNRDAFMSVGYDLNLEDMLFKYGLRLNNNLVQDLVANPIRLMIGKQGNTPQYDMFPWFYYPVITSSDKQHPISKNLDAIATKFVSTIDTVKAEGVEKTILLSTSVYTKVQYAPVRIHLGAVKEKPNETQYNKGPQAIAVLLEGEFPSVFTNRLKPNTLAMTDTIKEFTNRAKSLPSKMIVVTDGDIITNRKGKQGENLPTGYYRATGETFANQQFLLNCLEYLTDNSGLIESRTREVKLRLLDQGKINQQKTFWQLLNLIVPLLVVVLFGVFYSFIRTKKYAS